MRVCRKKEQGTETEIEKLENAEADRVRQNDKLRVGFAHKKNEEGEKTRDREQQTEKKDKGRKTYVKIELETERKGN